MALNNDEAAGKRKLALIVEYDGTNYRGFQYQSNARSVQGELEQAVERLLGVNTRIKAASRTDTGVHAEGQVVTFETDATYTETVFLEALNHYLPEDVRVKAVYRVPWEFNPRKDAYSREYQYRILNTKASSALLRNLAHWERRTLDIERMQQAAQRLVGEHDFRAFTVPQGIGKSTCRKVYRWDVEREDNVVVITSEANAYLYQQIRRTAGALVKVGLGESNVEDFERLLEEKWCGSAVPLLPARGLFLVRVRYPDFPPESGVNDDKDNQDILRQIRNGQA
jgi:tRNA pseudouridine38-40 synthase